MTGTEALEQVLQEKYHLSPEAYKEGDDWYRFEIKECKFQAGMHDEELYFCIHFSEIDHEADFDEVYAAMETANSKVGSDIMLKESDNYFLIDYTLRPKSQTPKLIHEWIEEMVAIANEDAIGAVTYEYKQW